MDELKKKSVLITGASSGLGEGIAYTFARNGSSLAICGRNEEALAMVRDKCNAEGARKVVCIIADLENVEDMNRIVEETVSSLGGIDILINNAGLVNRATFEQATVEDLDKMFKVNLRAPYYLTQQCLPHLKISKGCIVNISSVASSVIFPEVLHYSMTKTALDHFTKSTALELAKYGIRVNSVRPSAIDTPILRRTMGEKSEELMDHYGKLNPLGRCILSTQEIADTVIFLTTSGSKCITGACLATDRGRALCGQL
ncbi:putative oxidoreductase SSP0419 [Ciona intestinalis]